MIMIMNDTTYQPSILLSHNN